MKFITEYDVRAKFNEQSFTDFFLEEECRLTPGALSFLSDRKVRIVTKKPAASASAVSGRGEVIRKFTENEAGIRLKLIEAYFLEAAGALLDPDFGLSHKLTELRKDINRLQCGVNGIEGEEEGSPDSMEVLETEIEIEDLCLSSPDAEKIIILNLLYARTRHIAAQLLQEAEGSRDYHLGIGVISVMNRLLGLIKELSGVKTCMKR